MPLFPPLRSYLIWNTKLAEGDIWKILMRRIREILRKVSRCLTFSRKWVGNHFYMAKWTLMHGVGNKERDYCNACCKGSIRLYVYKGSIQWRLRGGGPLVISHKCRVISWLFLAPRPSMHFLHKTFPGTSDKIFQCAKFHNSSCLISWLPKSDLSETTERSPPL